MIRLKWNILQLSYAVDLDTRRNRRQALARRYKHSKVDPFRDISETEFSDTFRLGKDTVRDLFKELSPFIRRPRRRDGISTETKILIALAFYASGSYQTSVGQSALHNVSQKTVSRAVRQVTEALNKIYNKYVTWPSQCNDWNAIKTKFYQKFGIPGVLGCIDGTHVATIRPTIHEDQFLNREGFHSLNVMIICDSDLNILCVDATNPGSADDSSVWLSHPFCQHLTEHEECGFLLGDSDYRLSRTMITPILNTTEGTLQHLFFLKHATALNTVQHCIQVLKARFRCLLGSRTLHYDPVTAGKIVNACCVLHNIANKANAPVPPLTAEEFLSLQQDEHKSGAKLEDTLELHPSQSLLEGRALQEALVARLCRN